MTLQNSIYTSIPFSVSNGGTGNSTALTNGQLWIGNTGNAPAIATLTAGSNITITNSAGAITIAGSSTPATVLSDPTLSVALQGNTTYIARNSSGAVTNFTLPVSPTPGHSYTIIGSGTIGWKVSQNASQSIALGNVQTTAGTGGSLNSTLTGSSANNSVIIYCVTTTFFVAVSPSGDLNLL